MIARPLLLPLPGLLCLFLLASCELEPSRSDLRAVPLESISLGLPDRVSLPGNVADMPGAFLAITSRLRASSEFVQERTPDSLTLIMSGKPLRVTATLPALDPRELAGLRIGYRGSLGGDLGISWREGREQEFKRAFAVASMPGNGVGVVRELLFGPTRVLGNRISEIGIDIPGTEVGTVTLYGVELLLRPGRIRHHVSLDDQLREVLSARGGLRLEWDCRVPAGGRLVFDYGTHPGMRVSHGDGTRFVVEVDDGRNSTRILDAWLSAFAVPAHRGWQAASLDLSAWVGRQVTLRLMTEPGPAAHSIFPGSADPDDDDPLFTVPRLVADPDTRPNFLMIVIDTLRRDALGVYGGGPTPVLDSLATAGVRFDRAWAAGSWTHPSVASLLSGWPASQHGLGYGLAGATRLDPRTPLIAASLHDAGWATAAVSNNRIVSIEEGFAAGFTSFDQRPFDEDQVYGAQRVTRGALQWLDAHPDGPTFLYLHYFDPHDRYQAPPPFTRAQVSPALNKRVTDSSVRAGRPNTFMSSVTPDARAMRPDELEYMQGLYQGEVAYVDHWVGKLLAGMRERGALANTVVVVTSDHGEEFLEHEGLKHGHTLYDELIRVPLIVVLPGAGRAGEVVDDAVSLLQVAPMLRSMAGLENGTGGLFDGSSLPLAQNWAWGEGPLVGPQRALVQWPYKLIEYRQAQLSDLYDLAGDPGELEPLQAGPQTVRMTAILDSLVGVDDGVQSAMDADPALLEKLKAMGYVH